jgi:RimJ/RimL family protein N-acetyltransferase
MPGQPDATHRLAQLVSQAMEAADLAAFSEYLDPDVHWGPPGDPSPPCQNRDQVLSWYRLARQAGVRAHVSETAVAGDRILVGMRVTGSRRAHEHDATGHGRESAHDHDAAGAESAPDGGESTRWQVLTVRDGRVVNIVGFDSRAEAAVEAGLAAGAVRPAQVARWTAPGRPLADDLVTLRLPDPSDAVMLHRYATEDGGLDDGWVPLRSGASLDSCTALIGDWLAGWRNERSFHGPALVIEATGESRLAGLIGLGDRGEGAVELDYGVAPDRRGRGYASHAARLAARWLLDDGLADTVELRIDQHNGASRRAAAAAGFIPAGTVIGQVRATGETYEDLRYVLGADPARRTAENPAPAARIDRDNQDINP